LLAAAVILLAGCGKDKVTAITGFNGALSFTYTGTGTGSVSGTFSATGALPTSGFETSTWSAGFLSTSPSGVFVESATPASASTHSFVFVALPRTTAGSSTIDPTCSAAVCAEVFFELGAPNTGSSLPTHSCILDAGTIVITEITATRVKGTFSGTGDCGTATGGIWTVTIASGTFDVALLSNIP